MGDDRVIKLLKKYDDPKKVADVIMKKHPLLREAKKAKLPPHLAKFFDKKGNLKKDAADRIKKGRKERGTKITDRTPDWMFPEEAPPGWEGTIKAMKKKKEIDNPYALAWHMYNKGMKPHIPEELGENMQSFKELEEAVLAGRDYKYDGKVVKISKKNFRKVHKDFKGTTKGKETMLVLDPKSGGTISVPVQFEEVETEASAYRDRQQQDAKKQGYKKKYGKMPFQFTNKKRNQAGVKEEVELEEKKSATGYELYHKTFSDAMQHAYAHAKSKGFVVDPKEIDDKVATGPKKPSSGKTNRYSLKAGRKKVEIQVANLDNKRYELNMYIEAVELEEMPNRANMEKVNSLIKKHSGKFKWRDEVLYVEKGIEKDVTSLIKKGGLTATVKVSSNPMREAFSVGKMSDKKLKDFIGQFDPDERMGMAAAMQLKAARKEARKRGMKLENVEETAAPGEPEDKIAEKIYSILAKNGIKNPEFREGNLYVPKRDVKKANIVLKKAGMLKYFFNGLIGEEEVLEDGTDAMTDRYKEDTPGQVEEARGYTPSARDLKDYQRWAKTQAIGPRPVLDVKDIEQWTMEIYKGIKAGWKSVSKSTLGGDANVAIMIKVTVEPEKDWPNKILQNASFGMIRIATDGTMEMFASGHKIKNMRKTKIKTPRDIISKINAWIKKVDEEVDPHVRVMIKKGDSAKTIKTMHPEITDDELKDLGVSETISTFSNFIAEGRAKQDPNYVPGATVRDLNRTGLRALADAQKKKYSSQDIQSIARKYKQRVADVVGGKTWDWEWIITLTNGMQLTYDYGLNSTFIKGWKFDKKKAAAHLAKYGNEHETVRDMQGGGGKVQVTGLETAFELISEAIGGGWKPGTYKITDEKGKVLLVVKGGGKAQKHVDKLMQTGNYEKLTVELVKEEVELEEDAPANSVAGGNVNLDPFKKKRKNAKVQTETFGGQKVFVVSPERYYDSRLGKARYARYEKYVGNDKLGEAIRQFGRSNPKASIILKNSGNGAMLYLKYGRK